MTVTDGCSAVCTQLQLVEYVEKLQYEQEPDYALLRQTIGKLLSTCSGGEEHHAKFEWQKDD